MAQSISHLLDKPDNVILVLGLFTKMEGQNDFTKLSSDIHMHTMSLVIIF